MDSFKSSGECWEPTLGALEEQQVLLIAEPFIQPYYHSFKNMYLFYKISFLTLKLNIEIIASCFVIIRFYY